MTYRDSPHPPVRVRLALRCLALLVVPALAPHGGHALTRSRPPGSGPELRHADPIPYLTILGGPPLRFQEATPPPDLTVRPAASAPPIPASSEAEGAIAIANVAAIQPAPPPAATMDDPAAPTAAAAGAPSTTPPPTAPVKTPPAILPDNVRQTVRPEDFLPYFQIPGAARQNPNVTVIAPATGTLEAPAAAVTIPPSSASYNQSK